MGTTIYLLRHAAYESHNRILPFRLPGFHLSHAGRQSARKMATALRRFPIAAVYTSPLERTRETADIIATFLKLPVTTDDRLLEVRSPVQGKPEGFPESLGGWKIYESDWYKKEGGETPKEVFDRMDTFIKEKVTQYRGKEIVVVSHGDPIMFLVGGYEGVDFMSDDIRAFDYIQMGTAMALTFDENGSYAAHTIFIP